jgi:hypothetical protein
MSGFALMQCCKRNSDVLNAVLLCGKGTSMTDEDWEFNRIEMEARVRQMAVRYAINKASPIPLITAEEWEALNKEEDATE